MHSGPKDLQPRKVVSSKKDRKADGVVGIITSAVATAMGLYHLLYISHAFEFLGIYILAPSHAAASLGFILTLVFLQIPIKPALTHRRIPWYDFVLAGLSALIGAYVLFQGQEMAFRDAQVEIASIDLVLGTAAIILLLEGTRRVVGPILPLIVIAFLMHTMFGNYVPGFFHSRGFSWADITKWMFVWNAGIYSMPMDVAATIVIAFILFAQFLQMSGGGKFFIDSSFALFGKYRGGPAKVAIVASAFFGTLSGSTAGNVASTGVITIPSMKRNGFRPDFAGAVEAVSSNGGQLIPPVMGAVAFIMVEFLEMPYIQICKAALVPALLYFLGEFIIVDLEAVKSGIKGIPKRELPSFSKVFFRGWIYILPLIVLVFFLAVLSYAPQISVLYAMGFLVIVSLFKKGEALGVRKISQALALGSRGMLEVGTCCASAGIIIGCIGLSGIGQKLSVGLVGLAGGNLILLLLLCAMACFILGMGMTSIPVYIMLVILVAPAITQLGVPPIAAHLFVFYWGLVSFITPPVCIAAFVAAAIADSNPWKTAWQATRLGIVSFIIPFMFVYGPALLMQGSAMEVSFAITTSVIGVSALAAALAGYLFTRLGILERIGFIVGAILLVFVGFYSDIAGIVLIASAFLSQIRKKQQKVTGKVHPERGGL